jgi:ABC-type lipoprotein export system ATPase subunit
LTNPQRLLTDEPTANLDREPPRASSGSRRRCDELDTTFCFSTHDPRIMDEAKVLFSVEDGHVRQSIQPEATRVQHVQDRVLQLDAFRPHEGRRGERSRDPLERPARLHAF